MITEFSRHNRESKFWDQIAFFGSLLITFAVPICVGFSFSKCGVWGYALAYAFTCAIPFFWWAVFDRSTGPKSSRFDLAFPVRVFERGILATLILGLVHVVVVIGFKFGMYNSDESFATVREAFFYGGFPLLLWWESLFCVAKQGNENVS